MGRRKLDAALITWQDPDTGEIREGQVWGEAPDGGWWVRPCNPRDPHEVEHVIKWGPGYASGHRAA